MTQLGRRTIRIAVLVLAVIGAAFVCVSCTPVTRWWARALAGQWTDSGGDVLVVLGADFTGPHIGYSSYWRSIYAVWAWRTGGFQTLIISGGGGVGESMQRLVICEGIPAQAVRVELRSRSTRENALFTAEMLRGTGQRVVLLTSDFHMFRARRAFEKAGVRVIPRPFPDILKRAGDWTLRPQAFADLMHETIKILYYRANGWI